MDFSLTYHSHTPRVGGGYQGGFSGFFWLFFFFFLQRVWSCSSHQPRFKDTRIDYGVLIGRSFFLGFRLG